jgi:hypothetical protein
MTTHRLHVNSMKGWTVNLSLSETLWLESSKAPEC